jgi:hypothetical protein
MRSARCRADRRRNAGSSDDDAGGVAGAGGVDRVNGVAESGRADDPGCREDGDEGDGGIEDMVCADPTGRSAARTVKRVNVTGS